MGTHGPDSTTEHGSPGGPGGGAGSWERACRVQRGWVHASRSRGREELISEVGCFHPPAEATSGAGPRKGHVGSQGEMVASKGRTRGASPDGEGGRSLEVGTEAKVHPAMGQAHSEAAPCAPCRTGSPGAVWVTLTPTLCQGAAWHGGPCPITCLGTCPWPPCRALGGPVNARRHGVSAGLLGSSLHSPRKADSGSALQMCESCAGSPLQGTFQPVGSRLPGLGTGTHTEGALGGAEEVGTEGCPPSLPGSSHSAS